MCFHKSCLLQTRLIHNGTRAKYNRADIIHMQNFPRKIFISYMSQVFQDRGRAAGQPAQQLYSVSIWSWKRQHLSKPQACYKAVMEEVLTVSPQMVVGRRTSDDRWANYIFDPKGNRAQCKLCAGRPNWNS